MLGEGKIVGSGKHHVALDFSVPASDISMSLSCNPPPSCSSASIHSTPRRNEMTCKARQNPFFFSPHHRELGYYRSLQDASIDGRVYYYLSLSLICAWRFVSSIRDAPEWTGHPYDNSRLYQLHAHVAPLSKHHGKMGLFVEVKASQPT